MQTSFSLLSKECKNRSSNNSVQNVRKTTVPFSSFSNNEHVYLHMWLHKLYATFLLVLFITIRSKVGKCTTLVVQNINLFSFIQILLYKILFLFFHFNKIYKSILDMTFMYTQMTVHTVVILEGQSNFF